MGKYVYIRVIEFECWTAKTNIKTIKKKKKTQLKIIVTLDSDNSVSQQNNKTIIVSGSHMKRATIKFL